MSAVISEDGRYRYRLDRTVGEYGFVYAFIGVNPSTADASIDDATVRKWNGFTTRWGASRYIVGNLFAFRSTDVTGLARADDPAGPLNVAYLTEIVQEADVIIPCWGSLLKLPPRLRPMAGQVLEACRAYGKPVKSFGLTAGGDPKHPLMLGYDTQLVDL